ncbi:MAG: anthranilate phosphoribosyltransferase [Acidobacteria bacterium]|nr:MAG: anthranilate phosphoribosyltransferase [Acidobacteriota bacterium]
MSALLERLLSGEPLAEAEAETFGTRLARGEIAPVVAAAALAALRVRGETAAELRGLATALRRLARRPAIAPGLRAVDVVGTGGDGSGSLNLSTGVALLVAAIGLPVIKHGNRAISSRSGSADLLEALGLPLPLDERAAAQCLERTGFTFLFAPHYHPAMRQLAALRRELAVRTVFNVLGPLVNPAGPPLGLIGAYSPAAARLMAEAFSGMEIERVFVVHGEPGWDEATPCGPFLLLDVTPGRVREQVRDPAEWDLPRAQPSELAGGDAAANAAALRAVFGGERGAHRDALVLGAALVAELAGLADDPLAARRIAEDALDDGRARSLLDRLGRVGDREVADG